MSLAIYCYRWCFTPVSPKRKGSFTLADVARSVSNKMINRHPHVFGDDSKPDAAQQRQQWEDIKQAERAAKGQNGVLDGIPAGLPPMQRALKLQKRAAGVGFDWPDIEQLIDKMHEEAGRADRRVRGNAARQSTYH
jgi:ATP diphosphatase